MLLVQPANDPVLAGRFLDIVCQQSASQASTVIHLQPTDEGRLSCVFLPVQLTVSICVSTQCALLLVLCTGIRAKPSFLIVGGETAQVLEAIIRHLWS